MESYAHEAGKRVRSPEHRNRYGASWYKNRSADYCRCAACRSPRCAYRATTAASVNS